MPFWCTDENSEFSECTIALELAYSGKSNGEHDVLLINYTNPCLTNGSQSPRCESDNLGADY